MGTTWKALWRLDPNVTFLNHGAYGACPIAVLEHQMALRQRMEAEPVQFLGAELEGLLDRARIELAEFLGAEPAGLAFVPNATTGVNTVLRSLPLKAGDELLTLDHEYNASRNALNRAAELAGARVVVAPIPFPLESPDQVIEAVLSRVTPHTRLLLIDHVTSQTALVMPIAPLIRHLAERGIDTLVDGAHAPGMLPLHLKELGAAYYTGNCHKWLCAPKGAAFLYVREELRSQVRPLVISHGANAVRSDRSCFHLEFDWMGTMDPTAYLCIPVAIRYLGALLPGGWDELATHNRGLALKVQQQLCTALEIAPPCPPEMLGSMASLPLPEGKPAPLQDQLFQKYRIEVPIMPWHLPPYRLLRISAQLYNTPTDYDELIQALLRLLEAERLAAG